MGSPHKTNLYRDLEALPACLRGEIMGGQLITRPSPNGKHIVAASNMSAEYNIPYQKGRGGPGGWWILQEPEVHLVLDEVVVVPDVVGWRKDRMPDIPGSHKFNIVPDWVCEILSPSTASVDRVLKKPLYARYGVEFLWLADLADCTLETFELQGNYWQSTGLFSGNAMVSVQPFEDSAVCLTDLMGDW
ncbi:Uma2 family endonuclease [Spongiibacter sp. KMU-158]|uniref:Uma2 family endonuclease n=2 Tax=Spongiibacter pelagi TaxID=2760804 RepID=A0A927C5X2_9GAMM|nr:Uma2 family endonuclease [Spongiibacter pelagi]